MCVYVYVDSHTALLCVCMHTRMYASMFSVWMYPCTHSHVYSILRGSLKRNCSKLLFRCAILKVRNVEFLMAVFRDVFLTLLAFGSLLQVLTIHLGPLPGQIADSVCVQQGQSLIYSLMQLNLQPWTCFCKSWLRGFAETLTNINNTQLRGSGNTYIQKHWDVFDATDVFEHAIVQKTPTRKSGGITTSVSVSVPGCVQTHLVM